MSGLIGTVAIILAIAGGIAWIVGDGRVKLGCSLPRSAAPGPEYDPNKAALIRDGERLANKGALGVLLGAALLIFSLTIR